MGKRRVSQITPPTLCSPTLLLSLSACQPRISLSGSHLLEILLCFFFSLFLLGAVTLYPANRREELIVNCTTYRGFTKTKKKKKAGWTGTCPPHLSHPQDPDLVPDSYRDTTAVCVLVDRSIAARLGCFAGVDGCRPRVLWCWWVTYIV